MDMSDLTAGSVASGYDLAIDDDAAADTGSKCHHNNIVIADCSAFPHFAECCHVCIVSDAYRKTCLFGKLFGKWYKSPVQIDGYRNVAFFICRSRYTNACSDDLFFVQTFFCDLGIHRLCDVCDDIFAVVFGSCLNFPFIQDFSVYIKKSAFYGCSADIDSKTIFFHFFCSSFFFASDF